MPVANVFPYLTLLAVEATINIKQQNVDNTLPLYIPTPFHILSFTTQ